MSSPGELPKKRKDFLPKMFPSLPEDSAVSSGQLSPHSPAESQLSTLPGCQQWEALVNGICHAVALQCGSARAGSADGGQAGQVCREPGAGRAEARAQHRRPPQACSLPARGAQNALFQGRIGRLEVSLMPTPRQVLGFPECPLQSGVPSRIAHCHSVLLITCVPRGHGEVWMPWCCAGRSMPFTALCGQQAARGQSPTA